MLNYYLNRVQIDVMDRYGLAIANALAGVAVCEVSHPTGCTDVYIKQDGAIYVEEGGELVALEDSFLASRFKP